MRLLRALSAAAVGTLAVAQAAHAQVVYSNGFGSNANGFSTGPGVGVISTPGNCTSALICSGGPGSVLGLASGNPFDNQTVSLTLNGLVSHTSLTLSFHLLVINSWDGNNWPGPDLFTVTGPGGTLLNTTFSNVSFNPQSYPGAYNSVLPPSNPAQSGAAETGTLGSGWDYFGNAVYAFSFTVNHTGSSAQFDFTGSGLQGWTDEGWALDNVSVVARGGNQNVVPEPSTVALMASGLLALAVAVRRRRA